MDSNKKIEQAISFEKIRLVKYKQLPPTNSINSFKNIYMRTISASVSWLAISGGLRNGHLTTYWLKRVQWR